MQKMNSIGKIIKNSREFQNKEITDCSRYLNIPIEYLDAIEKNLLSIMPNEDYASRCIKKYANYLQITGIELDTILDEMNLALGISNIREVHYKDLFNRAYNIFKILFLIILILISISIVLNNVKVLNLYDRMLDNFYNNGNSDSNLSSNSINNRYLNKNDSLNKSSFMIPVDDITLSSKEDLSENKLIQIEAKQDLWVEIKDQNGLVLFQNNFHQGDRYIFIYEEGQSLSTNDATNLEIKYDNVTINTLKIKEPGIVDINLMDIIQ
tara:strand:- start:195 stop:995 length:801 start_codon:yes stop_codon:yes gene_type:complete